MGWRRAWPEGLTRLPTLAVGDNGYWIGSTDELSRHSWMGGAVMLYTPSHAELAHHPKTKRLARRLGRSIPEVVGYLTLLWHFTLKYAPDGDLSRFGYDDIADGCMWEGEATTLIEALAETAWLDRDGDTIAIHDWQEYGGKYVQRKEANAARMREARAKRESGTPEARAEHVQHTRVARVEPEERRGEKTRVEERKGEDQLRGPSPRAAERERNPHWDALVEGLGYGPTTDAERKRFGKVVAELKAAGIVPEQILTACENYSLHFESAVRTPEAILKHISLLQTTPVVRANGRAPGGDVLDAQFGRTAANGIRALQRIMGDTNGRE